MLPTILEYYDNTCTVDSSTPYMDIYLYSMDIKTDVIRSSFNDVNI